MIERQFNDAMRIFVFMFIFIGVMSAISPKKEKEEIPVVYLPGISGPMDNQQKFEATLAEIERIPGLTVREELALVKERMGYNREEKNKNAANLLTMAVAVGSKATTTVKMQEELQNNRFECTTNWDYNYSKEDVQILGDVIWEEVEEFCDDEDGEYVAKVTGSVILHRVAAKSYYPDTVYAVIHQGEGTKSQQYATRTLQAIGNTNTPDYVYRWAEDILRDGPIGPANLVFQDNKAHGSVWMQYRGMYYCTSNNL